MLVGVHSYLLNGAMVIIRMKVGDDRARGPMPERNPCEQRIVAIIKKVTMILHTTEINRARPNNPVMRWAAGENRGRRELAYIVD